MRIDKLAAIFLVFAAVDLAGADCSWGGPIPVMKCGSVGENSTYTFFFQLNTTTASASETFDAVITFNWEVFSSATAKTLEVGKMYEFQSTYAYEVSGYYVVGHEIAFKPDDSICGEGTSGSSALLRVDEDSCRYGVTTNAPTVTPFPSETPTKSPTTSSATKIAKPIATILTFLLSMAILRR